MKKQKAIPRQITLKVIHDREFKDDLFVYVFDRSGELVESAPVKRGSAKLKISKRRLLTGKTFIAPKAPEGSSKSPSLKSMKRLNAFQPILQEGIRGDFVDSVRIPEGFLDHWCFCRCYITGKVVRSSDGRSVCGARVHICEVDRLPWIILDLPYREVFRLRDEFLKAIKVKPPFPWPYPDPPPYAIDSEIVTPVDLVRTPQIPIPPPVMEDEPMQFSFSETAADVQEISPQPLPPTLTATSIASLNSSSVTVVRQALVDNSKFIIPYLCHWPWWRRYDCDEIGVVETGPGGRFGFHYFYDCDGDKPDVYFWVEFQFGSTWETVYEPPIACYTYWEYQCGTEVTIEITDPRVPACDIEPDPPGMKVLVMSIGDEISLNEIMGSGTPALEGLTTDGAPFGGRLEPHVWFGRSDLIGAGITKYRWSYRRLTGPDGVTPNIGTWTTMIRNVGRHYSFIDSDGDLNFPFESLGPDGNSLFRIKPLDPPAGGIGWESIDAREDSASAFFVTTRLPHGLPGTPSASQIAQQTAGKYELKLELFRDDNSLVDDWEDEGIELYVATNNAPFGPETADTDLAAEYNKLRVPEDDHTGKLAGFRMVLRVDNNPCSARIHPITGAGLTTGSDNCGFIEYTPGGFAVANVSFEAVHPNNFATFRFVTRRGLSARIPEASISSGKVGDTSVAANLGLDFNLSGSFTYSKSVSVNDLLHSNTPPGVTPCDRAAFAERLYVDAMATDGWRTLHQYDDSALAAFALDTPCPDCP